MASTTQILLPSPSLSLSLFTESTPFSSIYKARPSRRMATNSKGSPPSGQSLDHLSPELLSLILEQLRGIDSHSLHAVRLVSQKFDALATPIVFDTLVLDPKLVAPDAEQRLAHVFKYISAYTRNLVIRSDLNPSGIRRILARTHRLSSIRWKCTAPEFCTGTLWLPSDVLDLEAMKQRRVKLLVEDLPLLEFRGDQTDMYARAIPGNLLSSLKLAHPQPALTTRLDSLKRLLLQSPNLDTLHYHDRGQGTSFKFGEGERLPAFNKLLLKCYDWQHSKEDVSEHWDFSGIQSLELISVPIYNFLKSINFGDLADLHTFHVEDYSAHLTDRRQEATAQLYILIKDYIKALEVLDVTCHLQLFPIDAILAHRNSLQVLRLRDHVGFGEDDRRCPTLWASDVTLLARHLRLVHTLELDLDVSQCDPPEFMRGVCAFPSLHTLTLHVQTVLHPHEVVPQCVDPDREATLRSLNLLTQTKRQSNPHVSWKRIVINVGGWKRVMIRRFGGAWRHQNENGIFAERCFVLERNDIGDYILREEMCIESSRRATPEPESL